MDLQITTPILNWFDTVKILHMEPTNVCQASCPLCNRETNRKFDKSQKIHLTVEKISEVIPESVIKNLDKMFMCGKYGDPAAGKHTLDIYRHFRSVNPKITLGMNTNGALQNASWWKNLAKLTRRPKDYVVFSIDGLADTNHIYRRGVEWDNLMRNVHAFISAGGKAHWDMLVYEHNEHQVDACENLARELGFEWFRAKVSKLTSHLEWLRPPKGWPNPNISGDGNVECFVYKEKSMYIDCYGQLFPCSWHASDGVRLENFTHLISTWNTARCNPVCKSICTVQNSKSSFINQWQRSVNLTEVKKL